MNLFKAGKPRIDRKSIPFLTIQQYLNLFENVQPIDHQTGAYNDSEDSKEVELVFLTIEDQVKKEIPIRCDHYIFTLCISGQGEMHQNQHSFKFGPGTAQFIRPGEIHWYNSTSSDYRAHMLLIKRDFIFDSNVPMNIPEPLLFGDPDEAPYVHLSDKVFELWTNAFAQIDLELQVKQKFWREIINNQIMLLMCWFRRDQGVSIQHKPKVSRSEQIYGEFRALIETNFQQKKRVAQYAQIMNLTSKHLSETVKKVTDHTALHFVHERLLHEAQYLLAFSNLNIKQIAYKLNFDTSSHFTRFFKACLGVTPLSYIRTHR